MAHSVFIRGGDALSAAGRGVAAQAQACLQQSTQAATVQFPSLGREVSLPYFRLEHPAGSQEQTLLDVARTALANGGADDDIYQGRTGLFVGSSSGGIHRHEQSYLRAYAENREALPIHRPDQSRLATWLHAALDFSGPTFTISTACSSAANALLYASWMIREGRLDHALVVGVEFENRLSQQGFFSMLLATQALGRPFDQRRDGIMLGECMSAVLLSRDAPRSSPCWRILGGGTLCDTTHPTNPSSEKIAETMRDAFEDAGIRSEQITAVKAHGTGTRANDLAEGLGLRHVFADRPPPFTSIKPVLGHTLGACGVLETLAFIGCLDHGQIPGTRFHEQADPEIGIAPIVSPQPWQPGPALLNYFGFGGNNCALVVTRES